MKPIKNLNYEECDNTATFDDVHDDQIFLTSAYQEVYNSLYYLSNPAKKSLKNKYFVLHLTGEINHEDGSLNPVEIYWMINSNKYYFVEYDPRNRPFKKIA